MKPDDYNPKAREAFGKTLIDISVAIFKGVILLVTVVPLTSILQVALGGNKVPVSLFEMINSLSTGTKWTFFLLFVVAFVAGLSLRKEGLRHIHELENER